MAALVRNNMLSATDKEAALGRIGCAHMRGRASTWNIVNWFVRLARNQKPFHEMAQLELELLRQEYRALQEVLQEKTGGLTQNVVTVEGLEWFRSEVQKHLEQLADFGQTTFGPFTLKRFVSMPRSNNSSTPLSEKQVDLGDFIDAFDGRGLLYHLSSLLDHVGLAILRCPHCKQIFLRSRADAEYCSRRCQANAYAQNQRDTAKARKVARGKKQKLRQVR